MTNGSATETVTCDGVHPETGQPCMLGRHVGYHETTDGGHWLDD